MPERDADQLAADVRAWLPAQPPALAIGDEAEVRRINESHAQAFTSLDELVGLVGTLEAALAEARRAEGSS